MSGFKQTEIGLIPESWEIVKLKDVVNFTTGKLNANQAKNDGKYPFFTCSQETFWIDNYSFDTEAVLLSGNNARAIYSVKYFKGKFNAYQRTYVITIKDILQFSYIFLKYILSFNLERLRKFSIGTSTKYLTLGILENLEIIKPKIDEQENITYLLSKIQSAIEAHEKIIQTTTELKKALMQKLFTEGLRGEPQREDSARKWDKVKLGSLAEKGIVEFQNGFPCGQWNESGVGIPQLRPFNVTDFGKIDLTQIKSIETNKSVEKYKLKQNDIVFNNTNSEELVGKTALWQNGDGYVLSNHMTIIRIKDNTSINPTYLANFLHKKWFDGHYKMVCRRHVNQASVSIERLKDMDLPCPQIDVQDEIAKSFISIDKKIEFANAKHQTLQVLFKSMLHHLMTGQIRVKDLKFS